MADSNSLIRNSYVLGGAIFAVMIGAIVAGYFLGKHGIKPAPMGTQATVAANRSVCEATLDRVRNFGITTPAATLTSKDAKDTDVAGRVVCNAKDGDTAYTVTVNVTCDDMSQDKCLQLWNVTDSSGATLFQHREFMPPDDETAPEPANQ